MILSEKRIHIPRHRNDASMLGSIKDAILTKTPEGDIPIRVAITETSRDGYTCELGTLSGLEDSSIVSSSSIFDFQKRDFEHSDQFNAVLVVPTGIGAELGGHSGDGGPLARLIAGACDNLITHPNVVNAADINELPENGLYVEGSVISRLLMGSIGLQKVRSNRVMMIMDEHEYPFFHEAVVNSVSAARAGLGLNCPLVVKMKDQILMRALYAESGRAVGSIEFLERLFEVLQEYKGQFDAVALSSVIQVPSHFHNDYFQEEMYDMVNPWGGVEAMLTHAVSSLFNIPSAHSPMMSSREVMDMDVGIVDPRKSAEAVSTTYLHCILKGLHRSPRIISNPSIHNSHGLLTVADVSCLIIPEGCIGLPTLAALEQGIAVIAVKNSNCMRNNLEELPFESDKFFIAENYIEAAGIMTALKEGVAIDTVRRPLPATRVVDKKLNLKNYESNESESVTG